MNRANIRIPQDVRDRLRRFGTPGMTYAEILTRLMDGVERERFIAEMRRLADEGDFVGLDAV